ncbi:MAG: hypothetical protein N2C12_06255 [Planctomycetales bacterium]
MVRRDYCREAWEGPPANMLGWWKSRMPAANAKTLHWAPNDIMLNYFLELANQPEKQDVRYVLTLLMIRRKIMRLEETEVDETGNELMVVYCPRREETFQVAVSTPNAQRTQEIQDELAQLLFAEAA